VNIDRKEKTTRTDTETTNCWDIWWVEKLNKKGSIKSIDNYKTWKNNTVTKRKIPAMENKKQESLINMETVSKDTIVGSIPDLL
jgi:hypothetical protein